MILKGYRRLGTVCTVWLACVAAGLLFSPVAAGAEKRVRPLLDMEFVRIPAGSFFMGSPPDELFRNKSELRHQVVISKPFYMQTAEVTIQQWRALMGKRFFGRLRGPETLPMVKVSWFDCQRFIKKLNKLENGYFRLPTEAEWEYACRAGTRTPYAWGDKLTCRQAMFDNNRKKADACQEIIAAQGVPLNGPAPVKSYPPNAWGLYDMHGNVWEWCQDWYGSYPAETVTDPLGPESGPGRIRRGGSWFKHADACRSANRTFANPATRLQTTGLRLVWRKTPDRIIKKWMADQALKDYQYDGP